MNKKNRIFLSKIQGTFGAKEVNLTAANNALEVTDDSEIKIIDEIEQNLEICDGEFGQEAPAVGPSRVEIVLKAPVRSFGVTEPDWITRLEAAGMEIDDSVGFKATPTDISSDAYTKDDTVWEHIRGNTKTGILRKTSNVVYNFKIETDINKVPYITFEGKGVDDGEEDVDLETALTLSNAERYACMPSEKIVLGQTSFKLRKWAFDAGIVVSQEEGETNGYGVSKIDDRISKFTCTVESNVNPRDYLNSDGAISIIWGPTGKKIQFYATVAKVLSCNRSYEGNRMTYDVELSVLNNDFFIWVNAAVGISS